MRPSQQPGTFRARHRTRRRLLVAAGAALAAAALIGVVVAGYAADDGTPVAPQRTGIADDQTAGAAGGPLVKLASWSGGGVVDLKAPGKPTVLFAMAGWCATCVPPARTLAAIQEEFGDRIQVIAFSVDPGESEKTLQGFRKAAGEPGYLWGFDIDGSVTRTFELRYLDTVVVLDANGRELLRKVRPSNDELRAVLRPLLASRAPERDSQAPPLAAVQLSTVPSEESEGDGQLPQAAAVPSSTLAAEEREGDAQTSQPAGDSNQVEESVPASWATIPSIPATVTVSPAAGSPAYSFTFSLSGFAPKERVVISFVPPEDAATVLSSPPEATLTVDEEGAGRFAVRPVDQLGPIVPGMWTISFTGEVSGASSAARIEIVCAC